MIGFVVIEFIADQQQYNYQETKYAQKRKNQLDEYHSVGFTHTGLWAYMRHPKLCRRTKYLDCFLPFFSGSNWNLDKLVNCRMSFTCIIVQGELRF